MVDGKLIDANNDISFTKIIIKNSENDSKPCDGCTCKILCKLLSIHPKITNSQIGFELNEPVNIRIGYYKTEISRYLDVIIETMKLNEISEFSFELNEKLIFPDEYNIKTFIFLDLKFQIELIDIDFSTSIDRVYSLNVNELIKLSSEHKNEANEIFKSNLTLTAFYRYQKSIRYLIIAQQLDKTEHDHDKTNLDNHNKKKILDLKALLYINIAACQIKYPNNGENVIKNCTKCLEIDPNNVKAMYRRSIGYCELNELDKAIDDLKHALKLEPINKVVDEKLKYVEELKKKKNEEMSNKLRKIFK